MYIITSELQEQDGTIGFVNKENNFVALTNWSLKVVASVKLRGSIIGVVVEHPPRNSAQLNKGYHFF